LHFPKPLYESLPWLYVLAGAGLIAVSHQLHSGVLSALLLIAGTLAVVGGAVVWLRRRDFRETHAEYWLQDGPEGIDADKAAAPRSAERAVDTVGGPEEP
jgi:hypothetical protein